MPRGTKFQTVLMEELRNPLFASHYIMAALNEGDEKFLGIAIGDVVRANGTTKISKSSRLTRQALYKMFSAEGNPSLSSIYAVLDALGLKLIVAPKKQKKSA